MDNWKTTNYYSHVQSDDAINFEDGKYYEIGFETQDHSNFIHQGIRKYDHGFDDHMGYSLKPFPTHAKEIILSNPRLIPEISLVDQFKSALNNMSSEEIKNIYNEIKRDLNDDDQIDEKERSIYLKVTFDWENYDDVSNELLLEDSGILDNLKEGVKIELI